MITSAAMRCGFSGGLVVDFPHSTKAKKYFLVLFAGSSSDGFQLPKALGEDEAVDGEQTVAYSTERKSHTKKRQRESIKHKDWVLKKKESQRRKGKEVRLDTKYTGRKRSGPKF